MDTDANEGACSLLVCKGCTSGAAGQSAQPLDDVAVLLLLLPQSQLLLLLLLMLMA